MVNTKNKIIKIKGGLGNQLFQYSFALFLHKKFNINPILDISWYVQQKKRKFQLQNFFKGKLPFKIISGNYPILNKILGYRTENIYKFFFKRGLCLPIKIYDGYWQDKFFVEHLDKKNIINKTILKKNKKKKYYVFHLRRDDFLKSSAHKTLSDHFYLKHQNFFSDKIVYIISDDNNEAIKLKKKLKIKSKIIKSNDFEAFNLIFNASGGIASNSTFCWWSIFLSNNRNWLFSRTWLRNKSIFDANLNLENTIIL